MVTLKPIKKALLPVDSEAAAKVSGPNYDEFQSDREIWEILQTNPDCILRVTMAQCDVPSAELIKSDSSEKTMQGASRNMKELIASDLTQTANDVLCVYQIISESRRGVRQIGLVGMALSAEIRTESTPDGSIIRNEGIREPKARGRATLIEHTNAYVGVVNNAVDDPDQTFTNALEAHADSMPCDFSASDAEGNVHSVWVVSDADRINSFVDILAKKPCAYVADGNHRSAAAAMLGREEFLSVFFPVERMGISPYNRLFSADVLDESSLIEKLEGAFVVEKLEGVREFQPTEVHDIGLYTAGAWFRLRPKVGTFEEGNAVEEIDADIIQRKLFAEVFGIVDSTDPRLNYVGGDRDSAYLVARVDSGDFGYAISLAPVTMSQFVNVCRQNRFMPPKSTWFEPKVRSGLFVALFD